MKHRATVAATLLLSWSLSWWTGSSGGVQTNHYKTEAACKAAALEMNAARKADAEKYAADAAAEERANPSTGRHGSAVDLGPVDWKCTEDKAQPQASSH